MKEKEKTTYKLKMISIVLMFSILFQILMPVIMPLKSMAVDNNGRVETSLANMIIRKQETTEEGIIPIEIYIEGKTPDQEANILGIAGDFIYDRDIFEELTEEDISIKPAGWGFQSGELIDNGDCYTIDMLNKSDKKGYINFTAVVIKLRVKEGADPTSAEVTLDYAAISDINERDTWAETDGAGFTVTYTIPAEEGPETYTITYNDPSGEATNMPSAGTKTEGKDYTIASAPTRAGYRFTGWNTEADGSGVPYSAGVTYSTDANLDLYAQWEEIKGTLIVEPNGGVWEGKSTTQTIEGREGTTRTINAPDPTKTPDGYRIQFNANGGQTSKLSETQTTSFDGWDFTGDGSFEGNVYTFGSTTGTLTANYIGNSITLPTATKIGSTMNGWYTEEVGGSKVGDAGDTWTPDEARTLFAHWNEIDYILIVNLNGGKVEGSSTVQPITGNYNQKVTLPTVTPPEGYTVTLNNNYGDNQKRTQKQTQRLEKWTRQDGTEVIGTIYTFGDKNDEITAIYVREPVTLEAPEERLGYTFEGWYTAAIGGTKVENEYEPTANVELFAHWTAKKYTITFNPGENGTVNPTTKEVTYAEAYGTLPTPSKPGGKFLGWYKGETEITAESIVDITEATTLTAKWEDVIYTLTINLNGGKVGESTTVEPITGKYNETKTLPTVTAPEGFTVTLNNNYGENETKTLKQTQRLEKWTKEDGTEITGTTYTFGEKNDIITAVYVGEPVTLEEPEERLGYTFEGWYTAATGGTKVESEYEPTANVELFAHWTANKYTVTFNPGENGTVNPTTKEVIYEETYGGTEGKLPIPIRPGYTFDGWYDGNKEVTADDIVEITNDTTLTAKWLGAEFTVTFDYGEGQGTETTRTVRNEEEYGILPEATKEGADFTGWFDDKGNRIESTTKVNLTENITLYARYSPKQYTVKFLNDDGSILEEKTVNYGETATYTGKTPEKQTNTAGYNATFTGWNDETRLQNVKENISVTATYSVIPIIYTITYENTKNADNSQNPVSYTIEDENIALNDLANQGKYIFKGWYTTNDEEGIKVTSIDTSNLENIILYAQWEYGELYLKSKTYKIGENNIDIYEEGDIYLSKINPKTTLAEFINNCDTNGDITVINKDGQELQENDLVGTNMTIKVTKEGCDDIILTAVVIGDTDGNGLVTPTDLADAIQKSLGDNNLDTAQMLAVDTNEDNEITPTDLADIIKLSLE